MNVIGPSLFSLVYSFVTLRDHWCFALAELAVIDWPRGACACFPLGLSAPTCTCWMGRTARVSRSGKVSPASGPDKPFLFVRVYLCASSVLVPVHADREKFREEL